MALTPSDHDAEGSDPFVGGQVLELSVLMHLLDNM